MVSVGYLGQSGGKIVSAFILNLDSNHRQGLYFLWPTGYQKTSVSLETCMTQTHGHRLTEYLYAKSDLCAPHKHMLMHTHTLADTVCVLAHSAKETEQMRTALVLVANGIPHY